MRRRIGIGALGVVDEQYMAAAAKPAPFGARGPGKIAARPLLQRLSGERPSASAQADAHAAFCALCRPRKGNRYRRRLRPRLAARPPAARQITSRSTYRSRRAVGSSPKTLTTRLARPARSARRVARPPSVIDADDRGTVLLHAGDQAFLHGRIMFRGWPWRSMWSSLTLIRMPTEGSSEGVRSI